MSKPGINKQRGSHIQPVLETRPGMVDVEKDAKTTDILDPFGKPLSPKPTSDPHDPLNWSYKRKWVIIAVIFFGYFMMIYAITAPIVSFVQLQVQFDASYAEINWTFAISNLGAAVGPLFLSSFGDIIGRRPVLILGTILAIVATGCSALPDITIEGYSAARFFQIFGATPSITIGLSVINDISWEHERGFRVGIWVMAIDIGSYLGPFFGSFVADKAPDWMQYHVLILFAILLILQVTCIPETLYPRTNILYLERRDLQSNTMKRTQPPFFDVHKIQGVKHPKPWRAMESFFKMFGKPGIALPVLVFTFSLYWWVISVETMIPIAYADYSTISQGLMFLGLVVGTIVAEAAFSGWLGDQIVGRLSTSRGLPRSPEMRLWMAYPGATFFAAGLAIWGFSIENHYHFMVGQIAFFLSELITGIMSMQILEADADLVGAGLQMTNTVIAAYVIDNCPEASMEIITFYSACTNLGSFANSWFITDWVSCQGFSLTFGVQAVICGATMVPVLILLHNFGSKLRSWNPITIETNEVEIS